MATAAQVCERVYGVQGALGVVDDLTPANTHAATVVIVEKAAPDRRKGSVGRI